MLLPFVFALTTLAPTPAIARGARERHAVIEFSEPAA